jgi:hypothetical protein
MTGRKILLLASVISFALAAECQSKKNENVGDFYLHTEKKLADYVLPELKKTKTLFFYGRESGKSLDSLKQAVLSAWDITPIVFEPAEKFWDYQGIAGYSQFAIQSTVVGASWQNKNGFERGVTNTHYYLVLRPENYPGLCRIELYPDAETLLNKKYKNSNEEILKGIDPGNNFKVERVYREGIFYNWSPVYLKAHLSQVANDLKAGRRPKLDEEYRINNLKELLSGDTLYISKLQLIKFNPLSGNEKDKRDDLLKEYRFPYRICTDSELYEIFISQNRGRFLFEYVKSSSFKLIKVHDMKAGETIYKHFETGYNLRSGDFSALLK